MSKEIITFGDIKIEKEKFHHRKNQDQDINIEDQDIKKYRCLICFL